MGITASPLEVPAFGRPESILVTAGTESTYPRLVHQRLRWLPKPSSACSGKDAERCPTSPQAKHFRRCSVIFGIRQGISSTVVRRAGSIDQHFSPRTLLFFATLRARWVRQALTCRKTRLAALRKVWRQCVQWLPCASVLGLMAETYQRPSCL